MIAGILAAALAVLLVSFRGSVPALVASVLFRRWCTWVVIAAFFGLAVLAGPLAFALLMVLIGCQGAREYARLVGLGRADRLVLLVGASALPLAPLLPGRPLLSALVVCGLVATLPALLTQDVHDGPGRVGLIASGLLCLALPLALLVHLAADPRGGPGLVLALALAVGLSDVGAFVFGRLLGGPGLAARLSPSKTRVGLVGNLVGAGLGLWLAEGWLPAVLSPALALAPLVALGAVWGDLLESLFKRAAGLKDSGRCLPGFGGLLDRVDSLLVVAPLFYLAVEVSPWLR